MAKLFSNKYFASLVRSGDPHADVTAFLQGAGRLDTLAHCQAVAAQARVLAERFGVDEERAKLAAICHDLAAVVPHRDAVLVAELYGLAPDPVERAAPVLLHGPIAAAVLARKLAITDPDLLNAVKYHSTSRPGASALERVIFVADKIALDPSSPVRGFVPAVRSAAEGSLEQAALVYLSWVVTHGERLGWMIHPNVRGAHDELQRVENLDR
jgi:predicted HD superfamily hydrolase involved in NAD metabolism